MDPKILVVERDQEALDNLVAQLGDRYDLEPAIGGDAALDALRTKGPFAVVLAALRMQGMSGIQLLRHAFDDAPKTTRLIISGPTDTETVLKAVNEVHAFRLLIKPVRAKLLTQAIDEAVAQHRLLNAEQELLASTLTGSVKTLVDILSLNNPIAFGRASRVRRLVSELGERLNVPNMWELEISALLSQIGLVAISEATWAKVRNHEWLSPEETNALHGHPRIAADLLGNIPRLANVAEIVLYQNKQFDGQGFPDDGRRHEEIPLGSRLLRLASDFESLVTAGGSPQLAVEELRERRGVYDPELVRRLEEFVGLKPQAVVLSRPLREIPDRAILAEDVVTLSGEVLVPGGSELTPAIRVQLHAQIAMGELRDLFLVEETVSQPLPQESATTRRPVDLMA